MALEPPIMNLNMACAVGVKLHYINQGWIPKKCNITNNENLLWVHNMIGKLSKVIRNTFDLVISLESDDLKLT